MKKPKDERVWVAVTGAPVAVALSLDDLHDQLDRMNYRCNSCGGYRGVEVRRATLILDPDRRPK